MKRMLGTHIVGLFITIVGCIAALTWLFYAEHQQYEVIEFVSVIIVTFSVFFLYAQIFSLVQKLIEIKAKKAEATIRMRAILNHITEGIIIADNKGKIDSLNPSAAEMFGYDSKELIGKSVWYLTPEPAKGNADEEINTYMQPGYKETVGVKLNGERFLMELNISKMEFEQNEFYVGVMRDISQRKTSELQLQESEMKFRSAFDFSPSGMALVSLEGRWLRVNKALCHMIGYTEVELLKTDFQSLTYSADLVEELSYKKQLLNGKISHYQMEKRYIKKDKKLMWVLVSGSLIRNENGQPLYYLSQVQDINDKKQVEENLAYQANYDSLTGLINRMQLRHSLESSISLAKRYNHSFAVLFLDIDHFKTVNDTLGHDAGDELLKVMAQRLKSNIRKSDIAARIGGDEFVIILHGAHTPEIAAVFAEKIITTCKSPIKIKGNELFITTSIGISFYKADGDTVDEILKSADLALYIAKENGRNNYQFCTPAMNSQIKEKSQFKEALLLAFNHQEFQLYFQPKMEMKQHRIVGFEALLRWKSEAYGNVSPAKIISMAEEMGMTVEIGNWICKMACEQAKTWNKYTAFPKKVTINISPKHYANPSFVGDILKVLDDTQLSGKYLDLEITESIIMHDPEYSLKIIKELQSNGIEVTIDNFGTGYSSINYLQKFSVNRIKADKKFTKSEDDNNSATILLKAMIGLARNLNIKLQAEGVETKEQFDYLAQMGCDEIQGYYIGHPISAQEVPMFLKEIDKTLIDA